MDIRNVYCVGRNYRLHAAELGNEVPSSPMLFLKPSHAAVALSAETVLSVPGNQGPVHYEAELVFRAVRAYEPGIRPEELFSRMTVGLDLTLRSIQDTLKAKGHPWLPAKGFRNSAPLGEWIPFPGMDAMSGLAFGLRKNGIEVQRGNPADMVFGLEQLAVFVGETYGLADGDLLFTGTPAGVGALEDGDDLELWLGDLTLGRAKVRAEG